MGVSQPRISQIFAGRDTLTLTTLARLADALDLDIVVSVAPRPA